MFKRGRVLLKQNRQTELFSLLHRKSLEDPIYGDFADPTVAIRRVETNAVLENQIDREYLRLALRERAFPCFDRQRPPSHLCRHMVINLLERPGVDEHQIYNEALDSLGFKTNGYAAGRFLGQSNEHHLLPRVLGWLSYSLFQNKMIK